MKLVELVILVMLFIAVTFVAAIFAADGYHDYNCFVVGAAVVGVVVVFWAVLTVVINGALAAIGASHKHFVRIPFEAIALAIFMFTVGLVL